MESLSRDNLSYHASIWSICIIIRFVGQISFIFIPTFWLSRLKNNYLFFVSRNWMIIITLITIYLCESTWYDFFLCDFSSPQLPLTFINNDKGVVQHFCWGCISPNTSYTRWTCSTLNRCDNMFYCVQTCKQRAKLSDFFFQMFPIHLNFPLGFLISNKSK